MSTPAARTATLAEALREVVDFRLSNVHTVMPGKIQSYDKDKQTAEVVLCIKRRVHTESGEDILEDFPPLPNVRIEFPQTANFFMSFPLAAGDFVWVHFGEQSLDAWFTRGGTSIEDPIDRHFDLSDAFAVPGRDPNTPISQTADDAVVVGSKSAGEPRSYFKRDFIDLGTSTLTENDFVAIGKLVDDRIDAFRKKHNDHTHPSGLGPTGTPAEQLVAFESVKAKIVRAK